MTAPGASTQPRLDPSSDSGALRDGVTNVTTPLLVGEAPANVTVKLFDGIVNPPIEIGSGPSGTGHWSIRTTTLANGAHRIYAITYAADGTPSVGPSPSLVLQVDTRAPKAPGTPVLDPASDTAPTGDNSTTITTPLVTGSGAEGNAWLDVYVDGTVVGRTSSDFYGAWKYTLPSLAVGTHNVNAVSVDAAGNVGPPSPALVLTITGSAPSPTVPGTPSLTGRASQVTLGWSAPADGGAQITLYIIRRDGVVIGQVSGLSAVDDPPPGQHSYTVAARNSVGEGPQSSLVTVTT